MQRSHRRLASVVVAGLVSVAAIVTLGPAASAEGDFFVDPATLPFESLPSVPSDTSWGLLDDAGYRIEVPENWNGDLVMWAHGYRGEGLQLVVDNPPIRRHILEQGFAWAASSYDRNGYVALDGAQDTKDLADYTWDNVLEGERGRTYIFGASMGGHVAGLSIEKYWQLYDGGLPICGVMGDYELFDYFLHYNLAAQQLGVGESTYPIDPVEYYGSTVPQIKANLEGVPGGWPFVLNEKGEQFKGLVEELTGGDRPNFDEAFAYWNGFPTATGFGNFTFDLATGDGSLPNSDGLVVVDNSDTRYQFDDNSGLTPAERQLNNDIFRVERDRRSRQSEQITGDLRDRVLSLHNLGDLFVPFHNQVVYANDVRNAGKSNRLVQRAIRGVGHCDFTEWELTTAFDDLINWVETGERPAGDEVLRPLAIAADDYGCKFSDPDHTLHTLAVPCD